VLVAATGDEARTLSSDRRRLGHARREVFHASHRVEGWRARTSASILTPIQRSMSCALAAEARGATLRIRLLEIAGL